MSAGLDRDAISCCKPSDNSLTESERMADLSHIDKHGRARMVDVGDKPVTARKASATGIVTCQLLTLDLLKESKVPKGNVIGTAELAGVMAAKRTADLIPCVIRYRFRRSMLQLLPTTHCRVSQSRQRCERRDGPVPKWKR